MGLNKNVVNRILTGQLHVQKICAKLVPKKLSVEQNANWLEICQDLLGRIEIEPNFLHIVIRGDESCVFDYDRETIRQSEEWHTKSSPHPKKSRLSRSRVKNIIIVFFQQPWHCAQRICTSRTHNHAFYKDLLERLRKQVQGVQGDIADDWVLQHDNAPAHTALSIQEFLAKKSIPVLPHPPYSPDLAP